MRKGTLTGDVMNIHTRFFSRMVLIVSMIFMSIVVATHEDSVARMLEVEYNDSVAMGLSASYFINASTRTISRRSREAPPAFVPDSIGSGFAILENGLVMTKMHVVYPKYRQATSILIAPNKFRLLNGDVVEVSITLTSKTGTVYHARVVAGDPMDERDIALLKIDAEKGKRFPFVELADRSPGYDLVLTIGNPFGIPFTVASGIVSNPDIFIFGKHLLQTTSLIAPGSSGGMIMRISDHKVVGMTDSMYRNIDQTTERIIGPDVDLGFGTPVSILAQFLKEELRKNPSLAK